MSKLAAAILILASVAVYDPPRMLRLLDPALQTLGSTLKPTLDGLLPRFTLVGRRRA